MAPPPQSERGDLSVLRDRRPGHGTGKNGPPRTFKMRSVARVPKHLKIEEATPILRDKFSASMTGAF